MDIKKKLKKLPQSSGVYLFLGAKKKVIYVGKASNLKKRVSSYFHKKHRDPRIDLLVSSIKRIDFIPASSSAEALIYESYLIKEKKPKFNIALKDDKSYPYLKFTVKDKYPRLFITRKVEDDGSLYYGPYTGVRLLRQALTLMRRIFPLRTCDKLPKKECLNYHIGQCIGPCVRPDTDDLYKDAVSDVKLFLSGKKKILIRRLSERMKKFSDCMEYEKALKARDSLEALSVVVDRNKYGLPLDRDLKELQTALRLKKLPARIEAFDISNIYGRHAVGSMVTFFNSRPLKSDYRRFRIKTITVIDDYSMIKEIVKRRYRRLLEEKKNFPDLILIDGGRGHLNVCLEELERLGLRIPAISIAKKNEYIYTADRKKELILSRRSRAFRLIQNIRDEAHRFAISYHKLVRKKALFSERGSRGTT